MYMLDSEKMENYVQRWVWLDKQTRVILNAKTDKTSP